LKLETEKKDITIAFFKSNPKYPIVKMYKRLQLGPEPQILIKIETDCVLEIHILQKMLVGLFVIFK
jgi:hypothetical protein